MIYSQYFNRVLLSCKVKDKLKKQLGDSVYKFIMAIKMIQLQSMGILGKT